MTFKKTVTLFFLLISFQAYCQSFKGRVQIGLLASQVDGDNMTGYHKPGVFAGIAACLNPPESNWEISVGMDYMQKGSKATNYMSEGQRNSYHLTLHQIGLPIQVRWNYLKKYRIDIGTSFNITPLVIERRDGETWINGDHPYRFFEWSVFGGFNYHLKEKWDLQLHMHYSVLPVGKSFYSIYGLRNNNLELSVAYTL